MKRIRVSPLLGMLMLACGAVDDEAPSPVAPGSGGGASAGSSANGGQDGGVGWTTGGTFVRAGGWTSGGTSFSMAGTISAAGETGGENLADGGDGAGMSNGGASSAGSGATGAGGGALPCVGVTLPAKTKWKASALESAAGDPPENVFDGDDTTRFSTGDPQDGDEWLEIDFGELVTVNEITLHTNNNDYFRHYQLRLSSQPQDFGASILKEDDGKAGTIVVPLAPAHAGRYLTIRQTAMVSPTWWSLHEVSVACR